MPRPQKNFDRPVSGIAPVLGFALVPGVIEQTCFFVACVLLDQHDLIDDIVERFGFVETKRIFRKERSCHVDAIEPHLIRIDLLMPKTIDTIAWMHTHLLAQVFNGLAITVVPRALVCTVKQFACVDLVDVVLVGAIGADGSIGLYKMIDPVCNEFEVTLFACRFTRFLDCQDLQAMLVMPAEVVQRVTVKSRFDHAEGPRVYFLRRD